MGGKNCIMIMDDANLELALEGCVWGGFGTTGQRCTAASRVIVHEKVHDRFVEQFVARVRALRVGDGLDPQTQMGPSVSEKQLSKVIGYVDIGKKEGARLACGGERLCEGPYEQGYFHEPTVFVDVKPAMRIAREEIFGPVVSVLKCASLDEAIAIGNGVEYGLSASLYTQDINRAFRAMREMYTGIFYVNAPTIGAEVHLPFGGTKATGNGHREAGNGGARRVLGVEVDLRGFQRQAAAGADRQQLGGAPRRGNSRPGKRKAGRFCRPAFLPSAEGRAFCVLPQRGPAAQRP